MNTTDIMTDTTNSQIQSENELDSEKLSKYLGVLKEIQDKEIKSGELYFVSSTSDSSYILYRGDIKNKVNKKFSAILESTINQYINAHNNNLLEIIEYNSTNLENTSEDDTIMKLYYLTAKDEGSLPDIPRLPHFIPDKNRSDYKQFIVDKRAKFWSYIIRIPYGEGDDAIYLFNKASESNILGRKEHIFHIVDDEYDDLDKRALALSTTADCLLIGDTMLIFEMGKFESIFRYSEQYIKDIKKKIPELKEQNKVENVDALLEYCGTDPRKIRRLDRVLTKKNYSTLTNKQIKDMVKEYNLDIKFENEKMVVTKENLLDVMTVLEDYCVETYGNKTKAIMHNGAVVSAPSNN